MRKVMISAILAATTLAIAAPAAAQWAPTYGSQYGNQYGNPYGGQYGNAYGYNNYGQTQRLMVRLNQIERQIDQLDRRNILSDREAQQLRYQANMLDRQLRQASYNGLNSWERRSFEVQIARLEQNIRYQANDGNRWGYNENGNIDRDRDGRDDRAEHQRWHDQHDGNRDHDDGDDDD